MGLLIVTLKYICIKDSGNPDNNPIKIPPELSYGDITISGLEPTAKQTFKDSYPEFNEVIYFNDVQKELPGILKYTKKAQLDSLIELDHALALIAEVLKKLDELDYSVVSSTCEKIENLSVYIWTMQK